MQHGAAQPLRGEKRKIITHFLRMSWGSSWTSRHMLWWSSVRLVRARQILGSWKHHTLHSIRTCCSHREWDIWTDHGLPVSEIIQDFILQGVQVHAGLQQEPRVQAHSADHRQQQKQLLIAVRPWTEGHTVRQVLQEETQEMKPTEWSNAVRDDRRQLMFVHTFKILL